MKNAGSISSTGLRLGGMLLCGTVLYFFANVQRVAIPGAVFNLLQEQWNVSAPYITGLGSAFMYVYALNQLFIGLLVDRYGGVRVIAAGALLFCTGSILFPLSDSLGLLYFSRALTGLGASALYLSLIKETMRLFERNYNIVLSLIIMIGYAGGIMANAPFVAGVEAIGLRKMLLLTGGVSILFYLLFLGTGATMKLPRIRRDVPVSFRKFGTVLKCRHNRDLFLFSGVNFGLYYVLQTVIGKKFLEDFCAMESESAAWVLSLMGMISRTLGGSVRRRQPDDGQPEKSFLPSGGNPLFRSDVLCHGDGVFQPADSCDCVSVLSLFADRKHVVNHDSSSARNKSRR